MLQHELTRRVARVGILLLAAYISSVTPATGERPPEVSDALGIKTYDLTTYINPNDILMFVDNAGSFAYDKTAYLGKNDGLHFPGDCPLSVIYAAGIWVGAKVNGTPRVAAAEYSLDFVPGPMAGGTFLPDQPSFKVYKINRGDTPGTNPDYADWPFNDGAPALRNSTGGDSLDLLGNRTPLLLGDQALWCVFNDADPSGHHSGPGLGSLGPLGVEVQLYAFAYDAEDELGRVVFMFYKIINKGGNILEDAYISLWADPDLGGIGDDFVGCDIDRSLGYCYNDGFDSQYGSAPPAVGFSILLGPIVPLPGDSAWDFHGQAWIPDHRNLPMTSFNKYINGTDPQNVFESYDYMQGLGFRGSIQIDPTTGAPTTYVFSGDPIAGTGWLDRNSGDRRFMMSMGPLEMAPGDTQNVFTAVLVGAGDEYDCVVPLFVDTIVALHTAGTSEGEVFALILDASATTGHDYRVTFSGEAPDVTWSLADLTLGTVVLADQTNQSGNDGYPVADGMMVKVIGRLGGVSGWEIPNGVRRFTWAGGAGNFEWEGFNGAIGWGGPGDTHGFGDHDPVPPASLRNVLLKLAATDADGNIDPADPNFSYGYRYLRGAGPAANPDFEPYILDPESGSYGFQEFTKNVPLSAWDMDAIPPRRLTVGFLENNTPAGLVDGQWWPGYFADYDNTAGSGPREWLWIYLDDYQETPKPEYMLNPIFDPMPIMYWLTVARRAEVAWEAGDEFLIETDPTLANAAGDVFEFTSPAPISTSLAAASPFVAITDLRRVDSVAKLQFAHLISTDVLIDVLPGECPNIVVSESESYILRPRRRPPTTKGGVRTVSSAPHLAGNGVPSQIEVAILGGPNLDANDLDPATALFAGVAPMAHRVVDVSSQPLPQETPCDCVHLGPDGHPDLVLSYDADAILAAIGSVEPGTRTMLELRGLTKAGHSVIGRDCLTFGPVVQTIGASTTTGAAITAIGNHPNPFNAGTVISYELGHDSRVSLRVFDVLGRAVALLVDEHQQTGRHEVSWDGTDDSGRALPSGMYFYRLQAAGHSETRKMILLK